MALGKRPPLPFRTHKRTLGERAGLKAEQTAVELKKLTPCLAAPKQAGRGQLGGLPVIITWAACALLLSKTLESLMW